MSPGHKAYDAEEAAVAHGLIHLVQRGEEGQGYTLFTNSQVAMRRIAGDSPRPGQGLATEAIRLARRLGTSGSTVTIRWVVAHQGVKSNEQAGL